MTFISGVMKADWAGYVIAAEMRARPKIRMQTAAWVTRWTSAVIMENVSAGRASVK